MDTRVKEFFWKYLHISSRRLMSVIDDENEYTSIRSELLEQLTRSERQTLYSISTITEREQERTNEESKWNRCLIVHYKHEQRLAAFKRDLHRLWNETFVETPIRNTRLIVGNNISHSTKRELIHNRPVKPVNFDAQRKHYKPQSSCSLFSLPICCTSHRVT